MTDRDTKSRILDIARGIMSADGIAALSFDRIARELGKTKQAVLYWYPSKPDLLAALFVPWLEAETQVATEAVRGREGDEAVRAFVRALADFHRANLDRFRMMYLVFQTTAPRGAGDPATLQDRVNPVTDGLYAALADSIGDRPYPRVEAAAIHAAVLGEILMFGLADALGDPLKHDPSAMIDALADRLTGR